MGSGDNEALKAIAVWGSSSESVAIALRLRLGRKQTALEAV
jgi:hypothetical protein